MLREIVGGVIQLNPYPRSLFIRVGIIYYRSTEWSDQPLTASILKNSQLWNYPVYKVHRTIMWQDRQDYLGYEDALKLASKIDSILSLDAKTPERIELWKEGVAHVKNVINEWKDIIGQFDTTEHSYFQRRFTRGKILCFFHYLFLYGCI